MNIQLKPSDLLIVASGAVALVFSFFRWFDFGGGLRYNAWDTDFTFPLASYIPIIGVIMAGHVVLTRLAGMNLPNSILGFSWPQIHLVLGIFAGLLAIGWLIVSPTGIDKKFSFWLSFIAAIGLVVGAIMKWLEEGRGATQTGGQASSSF